MSADFSVHTPHQAAAKSQAYVLPHSSGNPRRYLLLAQVLRQQNRTSPCPSSPLGADTRGLRNPAITLTQEAEPSTWHHPTGQPGLPLLGPSKKSLVIQGGSILGLAGYKGHQPPLSPEPPPLHTPLLPPQRAIGLPALPESSLQTVVAPGPGPTLLGCHHFPSGHRAHICQVSSKPLLLPRAESQKAPITALAHLGPLGPPSQPLLLLLP